MDGLGISLRFSNDLLNSLYCNSGLRNPFTADSDVTVGDFRRSFGGKLTLEGEVNPLSTAKDPKAALNSVKNQSESLGDSGSSTRPRAAAAH